MSGIYAVLLAAGSGERMGAGKNKVFMMFGGKTALRLSFDALEKSGCFDRIYVVIKPEERSEAESSLEGVCLPYEFADGGSTRQDSVNSALKAMAKDAEIVAVHDAARCFVSPELISECVKSAKECGSGVAGSLVTDTVKTLKGTAITGTLDRDGIALIKTPQVFKYSLLAAAHEKAYADGFFGTDESMLIERLGAEPRLIVSGAENIKLTRPEDAEYAMYITKARKKMRIGHGFDAHRFKSGRELILGGVKIEGHDGLDGHSDADVLTHAVMDALLGAAGLKDIGGQFPDTNPEFAGISSILLLERVKGLLLSAGAEIVNIDATLILEKPRIAPHIDRMRENIASALGIENECVNIKATTTEKMGFTGRGEGAAAEAVCLIRI